MLAQLVMEPLPIPLLVMLAAPVAMQAATVKVIVCVCIWCNNIHKFLSKKRVTVAMCLYTEFCHYEKKFHCLENFSVGSTWRTSWMGSTARGLESTTTTTAATKCNR